MKSGGDSPKVETVDKGQRGLRWTKHETLTLVTAKQNELEKSLGSTSRGIDAVDVKWVTIFRDCKEAGVERDASQCRKRWHSLYKEYRKVKEYETMRGNSKSYWMLNSEQRREKKLASFFEQEIFDALENYSRILPAAAAAPRVTVDAFRANNEELESLQEDEEAPENANSSEDGGVGCSRPETGMFLLPVLYKIERERREEEDEEEEGEGKGIFRKPRVMGICVLKVLLSSDHSRMPYDVCGLTFR